MAITYPLIQYGSVYSTDDNLSSGTRYIAIVEGLENYQLAENVGATRALDGTIYNQYQAVKDVPLTVTFPRIDTTKYDAIRDVIQTAITGNTTFAGFPSRLFLQSITSPLGLIGHLPRFVAVAVIGFSGLTPESSR